ncbi:sulfotransferase domain-containing protein [Akkermansiaceae bacterium]|nr:sulfotransferase domain-containing protein [Akkermansiaceae bacterium]
MNERIVKYLKYRRHLHRASSVILSFPKSGRTFLRFAIGLYLKELHRLEIPLKEITETQHFHYRFNLPLIFFDHFGSPHLKSYRKIGSINLNLLKSKSKIFLYRDPRPVVYSNYFQFFERGDCNKVVNERLPPKNIEQFIFGELGGLKSIAEYYKLIKDLGNQNEILFVSYKNMIQKKYDILKDIIKYLAIDFDKRIVLKVVAESDKDNMAQLEKNGLLNDYHFGGSNKLNSKVNMDRPKWNEALSSSTVDRMNEFCEDHFDPMFLEF